MISGVRASSMRIEIDLVDDGEVERTLHHVLEPELHVVAEIVEAELVVGAVGDVGRVLLAALGIVEPVHDAADVEPEEAVDLPHPFAVAPGEIVVDGHDMHALAGERIEIDRQGRHQRLAFAGLHLRDHAAVEHDAAHELDVEMTLAQAALGRLAHRGEGVGEDVIERLARGQALLECRGTRAQLLVGEPDERRLHRIYLVHEGLQASDVSIVC